MDNSTAYTNIDKNTLINLQYYMPENETLRQLANTFSVFSDFTRLRILSALALSDMCVNDLSKYLQTNQTTISHQLRYLKSFNAVADRREGKTIIYSLGNSKVNNIMLDGVDYILD
ncbi:MAG: winged helix-turn-helix transcriptional regulator [Clostridia bacterium]|nr:winged helix-turn-helix transcriptional regulator [Clostridia bacterium]